MEKPGRELEPYFGTSTTTTTTRPLACPPQGFSMPPITEMRRRAAEYLGREARSGDPPEHFNTGDWIARNTERRR